MNNAMALLGVLLRKLKKDKRDDFEPVGGAEECSGEIGVFDRSEIRISVWQKADLFVSLNDVI